MANGKPKTKAQLEAEIAELRARLDGAKENRNNSLDKSEGNAAESAARTSAQDEPTIEELRRNRTPLSGGDRLSAPKRPGFVRRWFNDREDRIQRAMNAGYRPAKVEKDKAPNLGFDRVGDGNPLGGSIITKSVGGFRAVLMEIPLELYKEDMTAMDRRTDATEAGIKEILEKEAKVKSEGEASGRVYGDFTKSDKTPVQGGEVLMTRHPVGD